MVRLRSRAFCDGFRNHGFETHQKTDYLSQISAAKEAQPLVLKNYSRVFIFRFTDAMQGFTHAASSP